MSRVAAWALLGALCGVGSPHAYALDCEEDTIREQADSGKLLVMMSGHVYEVLAGDEIDSMLWLPAEDVLICEKPFAYQGTTYLFYQVINKDEGESVDARLLR
jgi:hypothetical protein